MLTDAQRDAVFARRAEELAASTSAEAPEDTFEAVVFAMNGELYAFPAVQVHEVRPLGWLTTLPGTPAHISGLINVRGRIVSVVDLRAVIGMPGGDGPCMSVVLVAHRGGDVGVLATDRPAVCRLRSAALAEPPPGVPSGIDPSCVRGITPELVLVLDAERLLADSRLVVHHDGPPGDRRF